MDYKKSAVYTFRNYLSDVLFETEGFNDQDYYLNGFSDPISPILPIQDLPEFSDELSDKPHIVYDLVTSTDPVEYWMLRDEVTLAIVTGSMSKTLEILELLKDKFGKADVSADQVNKFATTNNGHFLFFNFSISEAVISAPAIEEAGRQVSPVVISYSYKRVAS